MHVAFNPSDYNRIIRIFDNFGRSAYAANVIAEPMQRRCATGFHHLLLNNLNSATAKYSYQYYTRKYAAWKKLRSGYGSAGWWKLSGDLINAVIKRKTSGRVKGWIVGINDIKDSGGKSWHGKGDIGKPKQIGMYATVMEHGGNLPHGGGKHPPRPLFGPTRDEYADDYWPSEGIRALRSIRGRWR